MDTQLIPAKNNQVAVHDLPMQALQREQLEVLKSTICKGATDTEFQLFVQVCNRTGLDPFARQIHALKRWDASERREVMNIQVSIDGFRLIANRSDKYQGQLGPFWCGKDGVWQDVWLHDNPPYAAKVAVLRADFQEPMWGVARFAAYAQTKKDGGLNLMWTKMGDHMIAKCAEALALRKAFPNELSGLYTPEEMQQSDTDAIDATADHEQTAQPQRRPNPQPATNRPAQTNGARQNGQQAQQAKPPKRVEPMADLMQRCARQGWCLDNTGKAVPQHIINVLNDEGHTTKLNPDNVESAWAAIRNHYGVIDDDPVDANAALFDQAAEQFAANNYPAN